MEAVCHDAGLSRLMVVACTTERLSPYHDVNGCLLPVDRRLERLFRAAKSA